MKPSTYDTEYAPRNPDYGSGAYHRLSRISRRGNVVYGEMEDCNHGFKVAVEFDDNKVVAVTGEAVRFPHNTCPGAISQLQSFVGLPLDMDSAAIRQQIKAKQNCTHWFDLTELAYLHINSELPDREFLIRVVDEVGDQPALAEVLIDNEPALGWQCNNWVIHQPAELAGRTLGKGFRDWVSEQLSGREQEAALQLQSAYLVAQSRKFDVSASYGKKVGSEVNMQAVCYSYQPENMVHAVSAMDYVLEFTGREHELGQFIYRSSFPPDTVFPHEDYG